MIIGREIAVTGLRNLAYSRGLTMPASGLGKLKMASQVIAILLLILGWERVPLLLVLGQAAMWVVLVTALVSAVDYYQGFQRAMSNRDAKVADFETAKSAREKKKIESESGCAAARRGTATSPGSIAVNRLRHHDLRGQLADGRSPRHRRCRPAACRRGDRDRSRSARPATTPCAVPRSIENDVAVAEHRAVVDAEQDLRAIGEVRLDGCAAAAVGSGGST